MAEKELKEQAKKRSYRIVLHDRLFEEGQSEPMIRALLTEVMEEAYTKCYVGVCSMTDNAPKLIETHGMPAALGSRTASIYRLLSMISERALIQDNTVGVENSWEMVSTSADAEDPSVWTVVLSHPAVGQMITHGPCETSALGIAVGRIQQLGMSLKSKPKILAPGEVS